MTKTTMALTFLIAGSLGAADWPSAEITNGEIEAKIYLPDAQAGYYRATRFDWSGVVYSLRYKGHEYYGPWFQKTDPTVHDFVYRDGEIVASPCTAITGPADEFAPLGWDEAKPGGIFVKTGVGVLRRPDGGPYDNYRLYEIVDSGKRTVKKDRGWIEFTQELGGPSGYGYTYGKTIRLTDGKPEMVMEHQLKNTGSRAIRTSVYNHNFLVLDGRAPGEGYVITVPFPIQSRRPPAKELAEIRGNQIVYLKTLKDRDIVTTAIEGFSQSPGDNDIRIENRRVGAGMRITSDGPLLRESLWSIRAVLAMEPFVTVEVEPGGEFTWKSTYEYYTLPAGNQ